MTAPAECPTSTGERSPASSTAPRMTGTNCSSAYVSRRADSPWPGRSRLSTRRPGSTVRSSGSVRPPQPAVVGESMQQHERRPLVVLAETVAGQSRECG